MRLLYLSFDFPLPPNNGGRMLTWAMLRALVACGHELTLLTTLQQPLEVNEHYTTMKQVCRRITLVPFVERRQTSPGDYFNRLRALFSPEPYAVLRYASPVLRRHIQDYLARDTFDAVVCDPVFSLINLSPISLPIVLITHNIEHIILQRYLSFERNPAKLLYAWLEAKKLRRWEQWACQRSAIATACSENDRKLLQSLCPGLPIVVVPAGLEIGDYMIREEGDPVTIIYHGGMDWYPNRDAVEYFIKEILPIILRKAPDVRFLVAGRNPPADFRKRFTGNPNVTFVGTVSDMRPVIAKATVSVVPLRIGGGTRWKILEAAAMAKAVVSTRVGAEGLDFREEDEILLADEPLAFADAVLALVADPVRRKTLGRAARKRVEGQYTFQTLRTAVEEAFGQLRFRH